MDGYIGNKVEKMALKNIEEMATYMEKTIEEIKRNFDKYFKKFEEKKNV